MCTCVCVMCVCVCVLFSKKSAMVNSWFNKDTTCYWLQFLGIRIHISHSHRCGKSVIKYWSVHLSLRCSRGALTLSFERFRIGWAQTLSNGEYKWCSAWNYGEVKWKHFNLAFCGYFICITSNLTFFFVFIWPISGNFELFGAISFSSIDTRFKYNFGHQFWPFPIPYRQNKNPGHRINQRRNPPSPSPIWRSRSSPTAKRLFRGTLPCSIVESHSEALMYNHSNLRVSTLASSPALSPGEISNEFECTTCQCAALRPLRLRWVRPEFQQRAGQQVPKLDECNFCGNRKNIESIAWIRIVLIF